MVAEQGLYSTRTVRSGSSVTVYDVYTRGDVYVARYSPDYERIFVSKMEKHQKLADAGLNFLSFSAHPYRDRLYLLYNAVTEKEAGMLGFKEFGTRLWAVDAQGNSFEKVLFTNKDMGIDPLARFAGLAGNALMLYGQGKNAFQHRFIRIALD